MDHNRYWDNIWDEQKVHDTSGALDSDQDDFGPFAALISVAIDDYDKMVLETPSLGQNYDEFNLERFYSFCRTDPKDGRDQSYLYPFIKLEKVNQFELDEFVIGTWLKNHVKIVDI